MSYWITHHCPLWFGFFFVWLWLFWAVFGLLEMAEVLYVLNVLVKQQS